MGKFLLPAAMGMSAVSSGVASTYFLVAGYPNLAYAAVTCMIAAVTVLVLDR